MNSPALALLWFLWTRHRLGLKVSAACLAAMTVAYPLILRGFDSVSVVILTMIPPAWIFAYLLNILIFADEVGNLTSSFPRKLYTLPVPTRTLVLWPMLGGSIAVVLIWLLIAGGFYRLGGYHPPLLLPAAGLAVSIAFFQLLCWLPLDGPGPILRLLACLGYLPLIGIPITLLLQERVSWLALTLISIASLPVFYALAVLGVAHDRRGERWSFGLKRLVGWLPAVWDVAQPRRGLRSAVDAQLWYEERCHTLYMIGLPGLVLLIIFGFACAMPARNDFGIRFGIGTLALLPLITAGSQGGILGKLRPFWVTDRSVTVFVFARPISTGELVRTKYRLAALIVLRTWIMTLMLVAALIALKGRFHDVSGLVRGFFRMYPGWRGGAIAVAAITMGPVLHWKLFTDTLVPVLTGRRWLADGSVMVGVGFFLSLIAGGIWCSNRPDLVPRVVAVLTWLAAGVVFVKLMVTIAALRFDLRRGLLDFPFVCRLALLWGLAAALTLALAQFLTPAHGLPAPRPVILVSSLALLPMARFALAPLALEWNRRR
jgi:hypothetical protein